MEIVRLRSIEISLGLDVVSFAWSFFNSFCQKPAEKRGWTKKQTKKTEAQILALKRKTTIPIPKISPPQKKRKRHTPTLTTNPAKAQKTSSGLEMKGPGHPTPMGTIPQVQRSLYDSQVPKTVGFWWYQKSGNASKTSGTVILWLFFSFNFATFWEFLASKNPDLADVDFGAHLFWSSYGWDWIWFVETKIHQFFGLSVLLAFGWSGAIVCWKFFLVEEFRARNLSSSWGFLRYIYNTWVKHLWALLLCVISFTQW